jgi:hypothetical protein
MDKDEKIRLLEEENDALKNEVTTLKLQLDKYLLKNKNYYESHKEEHKKRVSDYQQRTKYITNITKEKKQQYARQAYLNKKEKLKKDCINENV